jgi:hypothetical protein
VNHAALTKYSHPSRASTISDELGKEVARWDKMVKQTNIRVD